MNLAAFLAEDVSFLLDEFGTDMTLSRPGVPVYDPSNGTVTSGPTVSHVIRAVFVDFRQDLIDGTVVQAGDRQLLVRAAGLSVSPQIGDLVAGLQVIGVRVYAPNDTPVAWMCHMRR